jgi:hypothetical protein
MALVAAAPILVTGSHRSGTTWTGRMLAAAPGVGYIHEPFSPRRWPGWSRRPIPRWYVHVTEENERGYEGLVEDVLAFRYPTRSALRVRSARQAFQLLDEAPWAMWNRLRGARPLIKDPIALMSAEWLAERFGMEVVVMIRHPAAFTGSLARIDWPRFDFGNWADQPAFLRDLAGPYAEAIRSFDPARQDLVDEAILLWNVIHHVIGGYRDRHPGWVFARHEDLAEEPVKGFHELYQRLDLDWDRIAERIVVRSSSGRAEVPAYLHRSIRRDSRAARSTWRDRLSPEQVDRVREGTAEVAAAFYGAEDWA